MLLLPVNYVLMLLCCLWQLLSEVFWQPSTAKQKQNVILSLYYAANWMRELVISNSWKWILIYVGPHFLGFLLILCHAAKCLFQSSCQGMWCHLPRNEGRHNSQANKALEKPSVCSHNLLKENSMKHSTFM